MSGRSYRIPNLRVTFATIDGGDGYNWISRHHDSLAVVIAVRRSSVRGSMGEVRTAQPERSLVIDLVFAGW